MSSESGESNTFLFGCFQNLKRKEREYEHEMERLAREKISLQQKIASLKKDMLGKWDHVDWQAIVPDDVDIGIESSNGIVSNAVTIENRRYSHNSESHNSIDVIQISKSESELDDSADAHQHHPLSLTVSNCHTGNLPSTSTDKFAEFGDFNEALF